MTKWYSPKEMCPEENGTVIAMLKTGEIKPVYYLAYEEEDLWVDADQSPLRLTNVYISQDDIKKWAYIDDLVKASEETKAIVILDKDDDYKPNYIIRVPKNVSVKKIQDLIWEVEAKYPGEYNNEDLNEAFMEKYSVSLEPALEVIW